MIFVGCGDEKKVPNNDIRNNRFVFDSNNVIGITNLIISNNIIHGDSTYEVMPDTFISDVPTWVPNADDREGNVYNPVGVNSGFYTDKDGRLVFLINGRESDIIKKYIQQEIDKLHN